MKKTIALLSLILVACNAPDPVRVGGPIPPPGIAKCNVSADFTGDCRVATPLTLVGTGPTIAALNYGWFGTGIDGSPTFDGSTTVLGMVPSGNVYTLTRDIFLDSPIGNSGISINEAGFEVAVKTDFIGPASGTFTIRDDGTAGSNNSAGVGRLNGINEGGPGRNRGGKNGGAGGCNNAFGGAGNASSGTTNGPSPGYVTGNGGAGGAPNGGAGATSVVEGAIYGSIGFVANAIHGTAINGAEWAGGSGAGGGGSNGLGTGCGGGGGGGGGYAVLATKHVTNPTHVLVSANGGAGGNASGQAGGNSGGGGGGGGGGYAILVIGYGTAPSVTASGGTGGTGSGGASASGSNGTAGQVLTFRMN